MQNRNLLLGLAGLGGAVLIGLLVMLAYIGFAGPGGPGGDAVRIGGDFSLTSQAGERVTEEDLLGKPSLVFFGFTHCPEICPTKLYEISQILDTLGDDAGKVNVAFISVDPERDDPDMLKSYLSSFHPGIMGLTGTPEEVAAAAKAYRVYFKKVPMEDGDYTMDHTAVVYLMDAEGNFVAPLNVAQDPEKAAEPIRKLL